MGRRLDPEDVKDIRRLQHIFQNNDQIARDYWQQIQDNVDSPILNRDFLQKVLDAEKGTDDYNDLKRFQAYLAYGAGAVGQPGFLKFGDIKRGILSREEKGKIDIAAYPTLGFDEDASSVAKKNYDFHQQGLSGKEVGFSRGEEIATGVLRGTSKIALGLAETGGLLHDVIRDEDEASALQWLEENFPEMYNAGELDTFLGKAAEYGIQYGTGWSVANKILQSIIKKKGKAYLKNRIKKNAKKSWKRRVLEIGAPAAISEPFVSTSRDLTLLQSFGAYDSFVVDDENLSPRERAKNLFLQKAMFGIEGVPVVGSVGGTIMKVPAIAKWTGKKAVKVGGKIIQPIGDWAIKPAAKLLTKEIPIKSYDIKLGLPGMLRVTNTALGKVGQFIGKGVEKTIGKLPPREDWKLYNYKSANNLPKVIAATLEKARAGFATSGIAGAEARELYRASSRTVDLIEKRMRETLDSISRKAYDIAEKMTVRGQDGSAWASNTFQKNLVQYITSPLDKNGKFIVSSSILEEGTKQQAKIARDLLHGIKKELKQITDNYNVDDVINTAFGKDANNYLSMSLKITKTGSAGISKRAKTRAAAEMFNRLKKTEGYKNKSKANLRSLADNRVTELLEIGSKDGKHYTEILNDAYDYLATKGMKKDDRMVKTVEELFGKSKDAQERILDTTVELANYVAKSRMYKDLHRIGMNKIFFKGPDDLSNLKGISTPLVRIGDDIQIGKNTYASGVTDDVLGPLAGTYTTPAIANAVTRVALYTDSWLTSPIYKALMAQKGFAQVTKTVYSPATQIRNVTSAALFAVANGHFGKGASLLDNMALLSKDLFTKHGKFDMKTFMDKIDEWNKQGLAGSGLVNKELQVVAEALSAPSTKGGVYGRFKTTDDLIEFLSKSKGFKVAKDSGTFLNKLYQFGDDIWKVYGYEFEKTNKSAALKVLNADGKVNAQESLRSIVKYYEEVLGRKFDVRAFLNKNGVKKINDPKRPLTEDIIDDAINDVSGEVIRNTYPNYGYVPTIVQNWRRVPLGNFISFQTEMIRTSFNLTKFALREFQSSNPQIREHGATRLIGFGIAAGGIDYGLKKAFEYALAGNPEENTKTLKTRNKNGDLGLDTAIEDADGNRISGHTPEEKMEAAQRSWAPTWNKTGTLVPVGVQLNAEGRPIYRYFNMGYQSPYTSTIIAPFFVGINTFDQKRYEGSGRIKAMLDASFEAFGTISAPFLNESIFGQRLADVTLRGGQKLNGGRVWHVEDDADVKLVKGIFHLAGAYTPGIAPQATKLFKGAYNYLTEDDRDMYYTGRKGKGNLPYNFGDELISNLAGIRIYNLDVYESLNDYEVTSYLKRRQNTNKIFYDNATGSETTPQQISDAFLEHQIKNYKVSTEFYTKLKDANILGLTRADIFSVFQGRGDLTDEDTSFLLEKKYWPRKVPSYGPGSDFHDKAIKFGVALHEIIPLQELYQIRQAFTGIPLGLNETTVREIIEVGGYQKWLDQQAMSNYDQVSSLQTGNQTTTDTQPVIPIKTAEAKTATETQPQTNALTPQVATSAVPGTDQGLTPTEKVLLSPEEQLIKLRQKGISA